MIEPSVKVYIDSINAVTAVTVTAFCVYMKVLQSL